MTTRKYPPISPGTAVKTTKPDWNLRDEWTDEGWESRQWVFEEGLLPTTIPTVFATMFGTMTEQ